jgi:hypothetical protein
MKILFTLTAFFIIPVTCLAQNTTDFIKGSLVSVSFYSIKNEASILEIAKGKYKVHYEDCKKPDEWVEADRVTKLETGNTASGPKPGKYICYLPVYEHTYMGSFIIPVKGAYQYLTGKKGKGSYKYDVATRKIIWASGDLSNKGITGEYSNTTQNGPMITLIFPKGKREGDIQYCLCQEGKK